MEKQAGILYQLLALAPPLTRFFPEKIMIWENLYSQPITSNINLETFILKDLTERVIQNKKYTQDSLLKFMKIIMFGILFLLNFKDFSWLFLL